MVDTIVEYAKLSDEEQQRQRNFYDEIRKHDEATALGSARREGEANALTKMANRMRKKGYTEEQIKELLEDSQ